MEVGIKDNYPDNHSTFSVKFSINLRKLKIKSYKFDIITKRGKTFSDAN
jgi:hypothetical protein